jgi:hypothetical protein
MNPLFTMHHPPTAKYSVVEDNEIADMMPVVATTATSQQMQQAVTVEPVKWPIRVEWENEQVGVYVDDDEEALLMTAQDGVRKYEKTVAKLVPCVFIDCKLRHFVLTYFSAKTKAFNSDLEGSVVWPREVPPVKDFLSRAVQTYDSEIIILCCSNIFLIRKGMRVK